MRRLLLLALFIAAPLGAQTMPPHIAEIARILQTGGLLPPEADGAYGPPQDRHHLLLGVAEWMRLGRTHQAQFSGFVVYAGAEPPDTLRAFVADLRASGVISARTERRLRQRLSADGARQSRVVLAQTAADLTQAEDRFQPEPLAKALSALVAAGALTPEARASVDSLLARDQIESSAELVAVLPVGVLVPDPAPGETADDIVQRVVLSVADMLRESGIADLSIESTGAEIVSAPRGWDDGLQHDLRASLTARGQTHRAEMFLDFTASGEAPDLSEIRVLNFAPLVNKALRDAEVEHRVYPVEMTRERRAWAEAPGTAFVALTAEQAHASRTEPLALVSERAVLRGDTLTTARTAALLRLLRDAGLLNGIAQKRLDALDLFYAHSPEAVLEALGLLLPIDIEMANLDTPYTSLMDDLAALSHGLFAPEAVEGIFDWDTQTADLAFTLGGTRYATDLEFNGDWMDGAALQLVDRALREASGATLYTAVYGRFDDGRPMAGDSYMILTEPQRALVEDRGWLELVPYTEWATAPAFPDED